MLSISYRVPMETGQHNLREWQTFMAGHSSLSRRPVVRMFGMGFSRVYGRAAKTGYFLPESIPFTEEVGLYKSESYHVVI